MPNQPPFDDSDDDGDEDAPDLAALLEEIPLLYRARAFADALSGARFLERLGEPLDMRDRLLCQGYLEGLGFPDADAALVESWEDAADAAESLDLNAEGWEAEEQLRAAVSTAVLERLDEAGVQAALALVSDKAGEAAKAAVEEAAAMADIEDEALLNAAAGAAVQAAHLAVLALLAADEEDAEDAMADGDVLLDHPFVAKFRLFARGRWPIGLAGRTLNVF
jgi:hypothetical protein